MRHPLSCLKAEVDWALTLSREVGPGPETEDIAMFICTVPLAHVLIIAIICLIDVVTMIPGEHDVSLPLSFLWV